MTVTQTQHHTLAAPTKTILVPSPSATRRVPTPAPVSSGKSAAPSIPRTTSVEIVEEVEDIPATPPFEEEEVIEERVPGGRSNRRKPQNSWFW